MLEGIDVLAIRGVALIAAHASAEVLVLDPHCWTMPGDFSSWH
jgi:hypothetical protein